MNRAVGTRLPEDDQIDIGQIDPVVARLRQEIVRRLEADEALLLPDPTLQALTYFGNDLADNDVDSGIVTEALLMGYALRVAEL